MKSLIPAVGPAILLSLAATPDAKASDAVNDILSHFESHPVTVHGLVHTAAELTFESGLHLQNAELEIEHIQLWAASQPHSPSSRWLSS